MGHEVMKVGLHDYFNQHKWGNTEFHHFVGAMQKAYKESGSTDVDLVAISDTWLSKSGTNIIEAVPEWKEDGSLASLKLLQLNDKRGELNSKRTHKIDVALVKEDGNVEVMEGVLIKETEEFTTVPISFTGKVMAIFANWNDKGYFKLKFDDKSLAFFTKNLSLIKNDLMRSILYR